MSPRNTSDLIIMLLTYCVIVCYNESGRLVAILKPPSQRMTESERKLTSKTHLQGGGFLKLFFVNLPKTNFIVHIVIFENLIYNEIT